MKTFYYFPLAAIILLALGLIGCSESNPTNSFEPQVSNVEDQFTFRANNAYVVTTRLTYDWICSGSTISIEHASGRTNGTGTLTILDAVGGQIYHSEVKATGTDVPTVVGTAGTWSVILDLNEYSGSVYFRIKKL